MRRSVGTEKNTAYGGGRRPPVDLSSILPPRTREHAERAPEEIPAPATVALTVDGIEVRVPAGATIFQAAEAAGYTPPHFCYHRDLSIPANCRMCLCEVEKQPKLQTSCSVAAAEGMVVRFDTPRVKEAVQGVLEFEFKNHPLDCPVCDQVGECYLQKYYLEVGKYDPQPIDRVRKDKVKDLGPITLDAERCVLCSRCVRFGEEIAGTGDFLIAGRSDHAEIMTFENRPIATQYALNYTDICPVGALTSNDFRFRKRVYYLTTAKSVCPECSTGCNIHVEASEDVVYRYRPRYNDDVNDSWMCDPGRLSYARVADTSDRLARPMVRQDGALVEVEWEAAIARAAAALRALDGSVAAIAHPGMSNEDLWELESLVEAAGGSRIDFRVDDSWRHVEELLDGILIRKDPHPNTRGALEILGLAESPDSTVDGILDDVAAGRIRGLVVCGHSPGMLGKAGQRALEAAEWVCLGSPRECETAAYADLVLPACVHVERDGTFTNYAGRVQRFWPKVTAYEESRPGWRMLAAIRAALTGAAPPASAAESFAALAEAMPAFRGLSYERLGDLGAWLEGYGKEAMPPVGAEPRPGVRAPSL
ncbi:MAG TPA: molybdopterin-dependent oxidoreductase [Gemmatimonadota bacterium]|nr:molybdopterin-dependent oxidoreductase [Gemmatimonadota bacterium]